MTSATLSQVVNAGTDVVWVEDAVPAGATKASDGGDAWTWISANPAPFSGTLAHQSALASGEHQHYFYNATASLSVAVGDTLFAYVYLDAANTPSEVMLQWYDGSWEHRAYWGANQISWGSDGTVSRRSMGALPATGQWVRLAVPASQVGLEGHTLNGMAYALYGGRATWDHGGKSSAGSLTSTTTALVSSPNPSLAGASVTFTATVTGSAPTGNVAFTADGTALCGAVALPSGTSNSKTATCGTASLAAGTHSIVATYGGDAANGGSTSATLSQVVNTGLTVSLVNPSFEIPALGNGYQYNPSATGIGWTFSANSGIQGNGSAWGAAPAPAGTQTAFIQSTGTIRQTLSLNAGSYMLSFKAAQRACCVSPYVQPLKVTVDGTQIGSLISPASTSFGSFSIAFSVATSGAHTITFIGTDPNDKTTFIDAVTLAVTSVANDSQAPAVAISSPAPGSTLKGTVAVSVNASDNVSVARVDLKANGALVGSTTTAPYTFNWDTTKVADGSVILSASAYDAAGNSATASSNETVANTTSTSDPTLTVSSSNPTTGVSVRVYPADLSGLGDGTATLTRSYNTNARVWLSASLRSGNNYFIKWQKDGVDYDTASTTSVVVDANHTLTAVYETPSCVGVAVYPGTDSIKNAVAANSPGTTFCIQAGIHRFTTAVVARNYDRYIGAPGAILNGSKILSSFQRSGSYWIATGQTQQEPPFQSTNGSWPVCASTAPACIYPEKVFMNGQDLWQVSSLAELTAGTFYFDYTNDVIYLFDDPTGKTVEATTGSGGIIGNLKSSQDFVTVKNLVFEKFGGGYVSGSIHNALKAADGWRVENNEFRLISYIAVFNAGNSVARNNYIHHNGRYGITGNGTFEGNVISYNNTDGWDTGNDAGASKFHGTNGLVARGNIVANNQSRGLWTDTDNINVTYENNIITNNVQMGILHEKSCAATIKNNVLYGNNSVYVGKAIWWGAQIFARVSKDLQILGNDVTAVLPGVNGIGVYNNTVNGVPETYTFTNCGVVQAENIQVYNNVVRLDVGQQHGLAGGIAGYGTTYNVQFSNNRYYLKDLAGNYFQYNGGPTTKEQWKAWGQDLTGTFLQY